MAPTITLISDWRIRDPYLSMFKSILHARIPQAVLLDISHHVDLNDLKQTAFLMQQSYTAFPEGTIHLMLTGVSAGAVFNPVVLERNGHYFVGEDNGIFNMMFCRTGKLEGRQYRGEVTRAIDSIVALTQAIVEGGLEAATQSYDTFECKIMPEAIHFESERTIEGEILYFDAHFNAITNIPMEMFLQATQGTHFQGTVHSKTNWPVKEYHPHYASTGMFYFTDNMLGCLEITNSQGKIAILADLSIGDKVTITY